MKKNSLYLLLSATLLVSQVAALSEPDSEDNEHESLRAIRMQKRIPTNFRQLDFITKIDGKKGFFDAKTYHDTLLSIHAVHEIQYGKLDKKTNTRTGLYFLHGEKVAVQQLVIREYELIKEQVAHDDHRWRELRTTLQHTKDDLHEKMKKLRSAADENPIAKNLKQKMINYYVETQKIPHSLFKNADLPNEQQLLAASSALEFFIFLNELKHFFEDLCASCPEAHKQYKDLLARSAKKG